MRRRVRWQGKPVVRKSPKPHLPVTKVSQKPEMHMLRYSCGHRLLLPVDKNGTREDRKERNQLMQKPCGRCSYAQEQAKIGKALYSPAVLSKIRVVERRPIRTPIL